MDASLPPASSGSLAPDEAPLKLTTEDLVALDGARGWARFNYLITMVAIVIMGLGVVALVIGGLAARRPEFLLFVVGTAIPLSIIVFYATLLRRYAKGIADHLARDGTGLVRGFRALKSWWIYMVIVSALSVTASLVMILATLAGFTADAGP